MMKLTSHTTHQTTRSLTFNVQSNHPPKIVKQPPRIEQRLSNNSFNEALFNEAVPLYEKALSEEGYNFKLKYHPNKKKTKKTKNQKKEYNMV